MVGFFFDWGLIFSRLAEATGMVRSAPCSGSWCWWWPRVSGAGADAAGSCVGSGGHISHTGKQTSTCRLDLRSPTEWGQTCCLLPVLGRLCLLLTHGVGLFSSVDAQVALQRLQMAEACTAGVAWVGLFPRVNQNMSPEVGNLNQNRENLQK